jgi:hypothetical protein
LRVISLYLTETILFYNALPVNKKDAQKFIITTN